MAPPKQLANPPKGTRTPGSGRKRGTPNRRSVEARTLAAELVTDASYQLKLRKAFRSRRLHPTIESLVWQYHLGRPTQPIAVSGSMALDVSARVEEERRVFAALDLSDLEQLAAESQRLVDRAYELTRIAHSAGETAPLDVEPAESLAIPSESDKRDYVNLPTDSDADPETPTEQ